MGNFLPCIFKNRWFLNSALALLFFFMWIPAIAQDTKEKQKLVLLNWSEYLDPELIEAFEKNFGVTVREAYYDSEAQRNEMLSVGGGAGYDLVLLSDDVIASFIKRGWLAPLNESKLPNMRHIESRWVYRDAGKALYSMPYAWGYTGIAYRKDLVPEPVISWRQLFQPRAELKGRILMPDEPDTVVGMALKALGFSMNSTDSQELTAAEEMLIAQMPFVKGHSEMQLTEESLLVKGDIWMVLNYSGDTIALQEFNKDIAFVLPEEGSGLFIESWGLLSASENKDLALAFLNFLHEPENAAQTALYVNYPTPNLTSRTFLPSEHLNNPAIYPSDKALLRSELYKALSPRALKRRNTIFSKLRTKTQ